MMNINAMWKFLLCFGLVVTSGCALYSSKSHQTVHEQSFDKGARVQLGFRTEAKPFKKNKHSLVLEWDDAFDRTSHSTVLATNTDDAGPPASEDYILHTDEANRRAWVVEKTSAQVVFSADFEANRCWGTGEDQPVWAMMN